jgi:hypothetical protein
MNSYLIRDDSTYSQRIGLSAGWELVFRLPTTAAD